MNIPTTKNIDMIETTNKEIELKIAKIFDDNGHKFGSKMREGYWNWPTGQDGDIIKESVNTLLSSYKSFFEDVVYEEELVIGKLNYDNMDLKVRVKFYSGLSTINNKYFSFYERDYENGDKFHANAIQSNIEIMTENYELDHGDGDIEIMSDFYTLGELEDLVNEKEVKLTMDKKTYKELIKNIEKYENSTSYMTSEQVEFMLGREADFRKYKGKIDYYKHEVGNGKADMRSVEKYGDLVEEVMDYIEFLGKIQHTNWDMSVKTNEQIKEKIAKLSYYDMITMYIMKENKKLENKEKVSIEIRPGFDCLEEITIDDLKKVMKDMSSMRSNTSDKEKELGQKRKV